MKNLFFVLILVLLAIFSRLIPHTANITAVGASALIAGAYLRPLWLALVLPIGALFLSDLILGFYPGVVFVYGAWFMVALLSSAILGGICAGPLGSLNKWVVRGAVSLLGTGVFFIVSNFGVWLAGQLYPQTLSGLAECYLMAIPFLIRQLDRKSVV